uniref:Cytochrome c oxidase subunit 3 n=1 Tax=Lucinella divaricata TaxID=406540 RepID=C9V3M5_9BIVA|nr:cytochrome c oxidase subunit III [Lucinella divaricata]ABJ91102.1 cytochrome c oxidase subunit 3 [Lucinella divaricata]
MTRHGYHMVQLSPWPLVASVGAFAGVVGMVNWFHGKGVLVMMIGTVLLGWTMIGWWWDVVVEATFLGRHTSLVYRGLRVGVLCFIMSEVFFFFTFFWSYIYYSKVMGHMWPPEGILPLYPYGVPLLNTVILVGSGFTVTWSQRCLSAGDREQALVGLFLTVGLGLFFTYIQACEFFATSFTIADTVYGSVFFIMTGFHGIHVIVGTVFLMVCWLRMWRNHFAPSHHFGFTGASWYWHFVDVVWIFLFILVYCMSWHRYVKMMSYY